MLSVIPENFLMSTDFYSSVLDIYDLLTWSLWKNKNISDSKFYNKQSFLIISYLSLPSILAGTPKTDQHFALDFLSRIEAVFKLCQFD